MENEVAKSGKFSIVIYFLTKALSVNVEFLFWDELPSNGLAIFTWICPKNPVLGLRMSSRVS